MASSFYKWLLIPGLAITLTSASLARLHPFHVSVVEINHNASEKTLEVTCKIFTDDFEKILAQNYKTKVDLTHPPDKSAMDSLVKKYVFSHLAILVDGKKTSFTYIGFEKDDEAVFSYLQVNDIPAMKRIDITNTLMHDMFTDQVNIMHVTENGNRKSTKLDYPNTNAKIEF